MHAKFLRTGFQQAIRPAFVAMNEYRAKNSTNTLIAANTHV